MASIENYHATIQEFRACARVLGILVATGKRGAEVEEARRKYHAAKHKMDTFFLRDRQCTHHT